MKKDFIECRLSRCIKEPRAGGKSWIRKSHEDHRKEEEKQTHLEVICHSWEWIIPSTSGKWASVRSSLWDHCSGLISAVTTYSWPWPSVTSSPCYHSVFHLVPSSSSDLLFASTWSSTAATHCMVMMEGEGHVIGSDQVWCHASGPAAKEVYGGREEG